MSGYKPLCYSSRRQFSFPDFHLDRPIDAHFASCTDHYWRRATKMPIRVWWDAVKVGSCKEGMRECGQDGRPQKFDLLSWMHQALRMCSVATERPWTYHVRAARPFEWSSLYRFSQERCPFLRCIKRPKARLPRVSYVKRIVMKGSHLANKRLSWTLKDPARIIAFARRKQEKDSGWGREWSYRGNEAADEPRGLPVFPWTLQVVPWPGFGRDIRSR